MQILLSLSKNQSDAESCTWSVLYLRSYRFQNDKFVVDLSCDAEFAQSRPHFFAQRFIAPI